MNTTSQDLLNLISALNAAVTTNFLSYNHAKGIFLKALDESGFNTEKPQKIQTVQIEGGDVNDTIKKS